MHLQVADHAYQLAIRWIYSNTIKRDDGVFIDIKKISTSQVVVTFPYPRINACDVDDQFHGRGIDVQRIKIDRPAYLVELATNMSDHHVDDGKRRY
jgi:hypothetical protein